MEITWHKLVNKVKSILGRDEAFALLGDFNRAVDNPKETHGKKLLINWYSGITQVMDICEALSTHFHIFFSRFSL